MPRRFALFGYLLMGVLLCVLIVVAAIVYRDRTQAQAKMAAVESCALTVARLDPIEDARSDAARGEDRFYFIGHIGFDSYESADGVLITSKRNPRYSADCRPLKGTTPHRESPFRDFWPYMFKDGPCCVDGDPPMTVCGKATDTYIRRYNAELARLNPKSVAKYCQVPSE